MRAAGVDHAMGVREMRAVLLLLSVAGSGPIAAQKSGSLSGVVVAAADQTPVTARIRLAGTLLDAVAAHDGGFRFSGIPVGAQTLDVRMLGYSPVLLALDIHAGETLFVKVALKPVALELEPVEVAEPTRLTPQLQGFEDRRSRGIGTFFTREDILRMQARLLTDVLRRVPGMQIRPMQGGHGDNVSVQTGRGKPCAMQFFVNGTPISLQGDSPVNYYIVPQEVVGIEVYSGSSEIPPQFNSSMGNSRCGVVVVWTRVGRDPGRLPP
jgi:hypothetical protein